MFAKRPSHACAIATSPSAGSSRSKWPRIPATAAAMRAAGPRPAADRAFGAAEHQAMVGGPARIVIRRRVSHSITSASPISRRSRASSGRVAARRCVTAEAAGERPELAGRVAGRDHHLPRLDDAAACGVDTRTRPRRAATRSAAPADRSNTARPGARRLAHHAVAGAKRIALRAAARPDAGAGRDARVDPQRARREPRRLDAGAHRAAYSRCSVATSSASVV